MSDLVKIAAGLTTLTSSALSVCCPVTMFAFRRFRHVGEFRAAHAGHSIFENPTQNPA